MILELELILRMEICLNLLGMCWKSLISFLWLIKEQATCWKGDLSTVINNECLSPLEPRRRYVQKGTFSHFGQRYSKRFHSVAGCCEEGMVTVTSSHSFEEGPIWSVTAEGEKSHSSRVTALSAPLRPFWRLHSSEIRRTEGISGDVSISLPCRSFSCFSVSE